ncbi:Toluene efflux pump outer membrane protein TtgI precursor [Variovorax sp. PBL-H6]|uniref:efflux transporter outer membrane subunit n=1 Tax=Variovorax sp. PBL-H6 TaxID=434009 RepID=UPI001318F097|nr:efflux transporter outer membrane subunit [Variovorax sp. PBL-H6]VTU24053.1 Toluene efflux pump outer membrane protein TtgI precursor [Variovorax sp. PBL-H6]
MKKPQRSSSLSFCIPWLAVLMLAGGCAVGPEFKAPTAEVPADFSAWHGGSAELLDTQARDAAGMPIGWSAFADPVLDALMAKALDANHDLQTAALRFAQSRVQRQQAEAQRGPQLNASAAAARQRQSEFGSGTRLIDALNPSNREQLIGALSEPHNLYQAGFDASWELDLWGRVRRAVEAADADVDASQAMLAQVQLAVQSELARNYFELRTAQRQLRIARDDIAASDESLTLVKARADGGLTTDLDVRRQAAQTADLRARLPQLLAQEAQTTNRITLLLGERPGTLQAQLAAPADGPAGALPDLSPGLPSEVALRRPDIRRAQAQLHSATASIGVAVADLYPHITLGANFGLESVGSRNFGEWGSRQWSIGPSLQLPLFDGARRRSTVTLRELQQQEAVVAYQQAVLKAWHEIDDALSAYAAERQRHLQLADKERQSRDAWELARVRYAHGLTDFLVQLDAQRTLLQAQRDQVDSGGRLAMDLVMLTKALGGAEDRNAARR